MPKRRLSFAIGHDLANLMLRKGFVSLRFSTLWLFVACSACAGEPEVTTSGMPAKSQAIIYITSSSESTLPYQYTLVDSEQRPKVGQLVTLYRGGQVVGKVRVSKLGPESHDDDLPKIDFDKKVAVGEGVVASSRDINPKGRFQSRIPNPIEAAELQQTVNQAVRGMDDAKGGYSLLIRQMGPDSARIITDKSNPKHEIAVVVAEASSYDADNSVGVLQTFLGIIERDSSGHWKSQLSRANTGCADCEDRPASYSLLSFGDFNEDGHLDLLLAKSAYETWTHLILSKPSLGWEQVP